MNSLPAVIVSMWSNLDPSMQTTIVAQVVTIFLAIAGGFGVVLKIGSDARLARAQQRESEALKLKLRVYEDIASRCETALKANVELSGFVRTLAMELTAYARSENKTEDFKRISVRTTRLIELKSQQADVVVSIYGAIERWQIIDPRIDLFKVAFSALNEEIGAAFGALFFASYTKMPAELSLGADENFLLPPQPISTEEAERISASADMLNEKLSAELGYIFDLQVEMQNCLLGDLFKGNAVPIRSPKNSDVIVLSLADHVAIKNRIFSETAGGKRLQFIERA